MSDFHLPHSNLTHRKLLHATAHTQVWALNGALFFWAVDLLEQTTQNLPEKTLVLETSGLIYIDSSGADALHSLLSRCEQQQVQLILCGLNPQPLDILERTGLLVRLTPEHVVMDWQLALDVRQIVSHHSV